jgi:two-component system, NtrC family, nitrogen regulation response regulator GlnG
MSRSKQAPMDDRTIRPILLVDDDQELLDGLRRGLYSEGWSHVVTLSDAGDVFEAIQRLAPALVTLDLHMPGCDGQEILERIHQTHPQVPVLVLTAADELETAVSCMKRGARDYLLKPVSIERLAQAIRTQLSHEEAKAEILALREGILNDQLKDPEAFAEILTQCDSMRRIFSYAEAICRSGMPVLVTGETGTGKELMARALHRAKHRERPFVAVNVAGLDDSMFSDTLFGHVKGAYSGAVIARSGLVEKADGGTLFLDEIGDLAPESQVKLLRLLQEGEYYPLGSDTPRRAKLWIVAATHCAIGDASGFRKDLYYRLQSHCIDLPPLRERRGDVAMLVRHACREAAATLGKRLSDSFALQMAANLEGYGFPGNVRELVGMVYDAVGQARDGSFSRDLILRWLPTLPVTDPVRRSEIAIGARMPSLKEATRLLVDEALVRTGSNRTAAAALLGISRQTLLNHLKMEVGQASIS